MNEFSRQTIFQVDLGNKD